MVGSSLAVAARVFSLALAPGCTAGGRRRPHQLNGMVWRCIAPSAVCGFSLACQGISWRAAPHVGDPDIRQARGWKQVVQVRFGSDSTIYRVNRFVFASTRVSTHQRAGCSYIYRASHGKLQALPVVPNLPNQNSLDPRPRVRDKGSPTCTCNNQHALIGTMEGLVSSSRCLWYVITNPTTPYIYLPLHGSEIAVD
jgi:hypothetical protein